MKSILKTSFILLGIFSSSAFGQAEFFAKVKALKNEAKADQAIRALENQIPKMQSDSDKQLAKMQLGLLHFDQKQLDKAEALFAELSAQKTNLQEYQLYYLAQIALSKKDYIAAHNHFKKILGLAPNIKMKDEIEFYTAEIFLQNRRFREARQTLIKLERRSRRDTNYADILYALARAERGLGQQHHFCRWARKLYTQFPEYAKISQWDLNLPTNEFEERQTGCYATVDDQRTRIRNLQWEGLGSRAKNEIEKLKQSKTQESDEIEKLEISYLSYEGETQKVMDILKPQYEQRKGDPQFLIQIGSAAARLGEIQAAAGSYYLAYKRNPRGKHAKQALYQAAFMSYQFQDYDGAARKFAEFIRLFPSSSFAREARWNMAWIRYLRGDYQGAFDALMNLRKTASRSRRLAKSFPHDRVNYWTAMCLYRMNRYGEARGLFEKLAQDKLLGYYSVAAQERLKKIDQYMPKLNQLSMPIEMTKIPRFQMYETMMSSDDPEWFKDIVTQKTIQETSDVVSVSEEDGKPLDPEAAPEESLDQELLADGEAQDRGPEIENQVDDEIMERPTPFSNPVLVKRFERARELMILGLNEWAKWDLYDIERRTSHREYLKSLMEEYEIVENFHRSSYIAHVRFGSQRSHYGIEGIRFLWEHAYPRAYSQFVHRYAREFSIPSELVWGIMRAESHYKKDVISPVGALGLMQVMPFTGAKVASMLGEKNFESKKLLQPESSIKLGSKYLQRLMKRFSNNMALVAAGYNAGPHRVRSWVATFGHLELDEFIEHIPYVETRGYVKKVMTNYNIYTKLYNQKKDQNLMLADALGVQFTDQAVAKESWEDI